MATSRKRAIFSQEDVELQSMVKRANQRLRELEKQNLTNSPAYKAAERLRLTSPEIMGGTSSRYTGDDNAVKFSTNIRKLTPNQRNKLRHEVERFLNSETSTVKGTKAVHKRMADAYAEYSDVDFSGIDLNEALNIWNTAIVQQYKRFYGSSETEFIVSQLIIKMDQKSAVKFLEDNYGKPVSQIQENIDAITPFDADDWEWSEIFGEEDF